MYCQFNFKPEASIMISLGSLHRAGVMVIFFALLNFIPLHANPSLDFPASTWGISLGNSSVFTGLRINYRDSQVRSIKGINITLWRPDTTNSDAVIQGVSIGMLPGGGNLFGLQLGFLGIAADHKVAGLSFALLGVGSGNNVTGITAGGLGLGCGKDLAGLNIAGLGIGAGENLTGITLAGMGVGAGGDLKGITFAGFGAGAGGDVTGVNWAGFGLGAGGRLAGLNLAGFGVGAGEDIYGLTFGGIGVGAGEDLIGFTIGGLGVGAGKKICGITVAGLGIGAGEEISGIAIAGIGIGSKNLKGIQLALGTVRAVDDGQMSIFSASAFNNIQGTQNGLTIGLVNFARRLKGVQIGIINIAKENPKYLRVLPLFNAPF